MEEVTKERVLNYLKKPALVINRCPEKTLNAFRELADSDFCSDYGMTLKFILENSLDKRYDELALRVTKLEHKGAKKRIKL